MTREELLDKIKRERLLRQISAARAGGGGGVEAVEPEELPEPEAVPEQSSDERILGGIRDTLSQGAEDTGQYLKDTASNVADFTGAMWNDPEARARANQVAGEGVKEGFRGVSFGLYDDMKAKEQAWLNETEEADEKAKLVKNREEWREQNPTAAMVANISGGMLNPINAITGGPLKNVAMDAATGGVTGAATAEEGDRFGGGLSGAVEGVIGGRLMAGAGNLIGSAVGTTKRIAKDLGEKADEFNPIHLMADSDNPLIRNFYQKIVGPSTGGGELMEQQAAAIRRQQGLVEESTEQGRQAVQQQKNELIAESKQVTRDGAEGKRQLTKTLDQQADDALNAQQAQYRQTIVDQTLPDGTSPEQLQAIKQAMQENPQEAMGAIHQKWNQDGFTYIKEQPFSVDSAQVRKAIADDIPSHMADAVPTINKMLDTNLDAKVLEGGISGEDLMNARNEFRFLANALGDDGKAALEKAAYSKAASKIDDVIKDQLDPATLARYDGDLKKWGQFLTARDAAGKAGTLKQGQFGPDEILAAERSNTGSRFSEGKSPLYKTAQAQQRAAKEQGKVFKQTIQKQTDDIDLQTANRKQDIEELKQQVTVPATLQQERDAFKSVLDEFNEKSAGNSKSPYQAAFANAILTLPAHAVAAGLGGPGGVLTSAVLTTKTATAIGQFLSKKSTQRYIAGQAKYQKQIQKAIADMNPKMRAAIFRAMPVAIRNNYIMQEEE